MATSGSYTFDPTFGNILDEAYEQAGIDPSSISQRHITSAKMSLNLMFDEWVARDGDAIYRVTEGTQVLSASTASFALPAGAIDLVDVVMDYNTSGADLPLTRISRQTYLELADKAEEGMPQHYYVDQSTLNAPTAYVWPVPDASTTLTFDYLRYVETAGALSETLDVHRPWLAAVASGLALRLARKYNLSRVPLLESVAENSYRIARRAGAENAPIVLSARGFGVSGRTRRR